MGSIEWADAFAKAPGQAYKTSKSALHMLNKQYALDYAEDGFTFLCVSPGVSISRSSPRQDPFWKNIANP